MTVIEHIIQSLRNAAEFNKHDVAAPSVILWTDGERRWESVARKIGGHFDRFYMLGEDSERPGQGPSTWIRYQLAAEKEKEGVPIVYLPGIARNAFRSPGNFPEEARHLYALQFQGQFWMQLNAKDWTPAALLGSSDGGLALDLAKDQSTLKALSTQLDAVLDTEVSALLGKRLEAADFNGLAVGDPAGMMLRWIADPSGAEASWTPEQKAAFTGICRQDFHFDRDGEGRLGAAEKLVAGGGLWESVWSRYEEAPTNYRGMKEALAMVKLDDLFQDSERLPASNLAAENKLREALVKLGDLPSAKAKESIKNLVAEHGARAGSIWAQLGEAPLAEAVNHLGQMLSAIETGFSGQGWEELAEGYWKDGWKVDAEARRSFAAVRNKDDMAAVTAALHVVYLPWLAEQAERIQPLWDAYPNRDPSTVRSFEVSPGTIYLFVDGLRADVAVECCRLLEYGGLEPSVSHSWAALPSVTATAKPAWAPLSENLCGEELPEGFEPQRASDQSKLTTAKFRSLLGTLNMEYIEASECGDPSGTGWTEAADFDSRGHKEGGKLAWRIKEELQVVRHRVTELLQAGWKKVEIVTDHGWLWLPGGLPKTELPQHLTASKWGRCAVAKAGAKHDLPTVPWFWANEHHVVLAPGVTALKAKTEYSHGGLTIQEALTVSIGVKASGSASIADVSIVSVSWLGLRLRAEFEVASAEFFIDVRTKAADAATSLFEDEDPKPLRPDGKISALIEDDSHEGTPAILVVLHEGEVICKQPVIVGEN